MTLADIAVNFQTQTEAVKQIISVLTVVMVTGTVSPVLPHSSAVPYF
jgi:hypothetical protein